MTTATDCLISPTDAASRTYDVVVVGAGIAGSIAARK